jgi:hypothetical protein
VDLYRAAKEIPVHSTEAKPHKILKRIITVAHDLARSVEFNAAMDSLSATGKDTTELGNIVLKLGQYYRATSQLVLAARRKRYRIFQRIRVEVFQTKVPHDIRVHTKPGSSIPLIKDLSGRLEVSRLLQRFEGSEFKADSALTQRLNNTRSGIKVHAEIKLLFFYEIHPEIKRPRIISANKSSCYLCDLFFRLHGAFQLPNTFGMLNERWILPDWCVIAPGHLENLRSTLIQFDSVLNSQIASVIIGRQRQPDPMESLVATSASWPDSWDAVRSKSEALSSPSSIHSYNSIVLVSMVDKKLTEGEQMWKRLSGLESSFILHFYESFIVLSSRESPEDLGNGSHWVKVSLMSLQDQPELKMSQKNILNLTDMKERAEKKLDRGTMQSETQFYITWNDLAVSIFICGSRLSR